MTRSDRLLLGKLVLLMLFIACTSTGMLVAYFVGWAQ